MTELELHLQRRVKYVAALRQTRARVLILLFGLKLSDSVSNRTLYLDVGAVF